MRTGKVKDSRSFWGGQAGGIYDVLCSDGKVRRATVTREADTFFTLPARVKVNGRTVTGHVYVNELDYPEPVWCFSAYAYLRNADALPEWPKNSQK